MTAPGMIILKLADIEVPNNECCEFISETGQFSNQMRNSIKFDSINSKRFEFISANQLIPAFGLNCRFLFQQIY